MGWRAHTQQRAARKWCIKPWSGIHRARRIIKWITIWVEGGGGLSLFFKTYLTHCSSSYHLNVERRRRSSWWWSTGTSSRVSLCAVRPRAIRPPPIEETNKDRKTHSGLMILIPCASLRLSFNLLMGLRREREKEKGGISVYTMWRSISRTDACGTCYVYFLSIISFANWAYTNIRDIPFS